MVYGIGISPKGIGNDQGGFCLNQKLGRPFQGLVICLNGRWRREPGNVRDLDVFLDFILLQVRIVTDVNGGHGFRRRDPVSTDEGFRYAGQIRRLIVPLYVFANLCRLNLGRVNPVDPGAPPIGGHWTRPTEHDDRYPVTPGVKDGHGGMLQADDIVNDGHHGFPLGLGVTMGHGHRNFLVVAKDDLGFIIATVVDNGVVNPTKARPRNKGGILDIE